MKLISCHIENFGKLCDLTLQFEEGVHAVCHANGWGKSTFAAFLRVMFYGFEGERKRVGRNERNFYRPWQGGVYGGQIVFETGGRQYQMAKVFGKKGSEDTFELRDVSTNMASSDYTAAIGRELFGIDSEAFLRTVFIGQNDCATQTTGEINAKIGNLTEQTDDLSSYDASMTRIKDLMNQMAPNRKRGSIRQLEDEATRLMAEQKREAVICDAVQELQIKLETEQKTLRRLKTEQGEILEKQKLASSMKEAQAKKERYEEICARYQNAEEALGEAKKSFPKEPPKEEELAWALGQCTQIERANASLENLRMQPQEEADLSALRRKFAGGIPLEEDCEAIREKNLLLLSLQREDAKKGWQQIGAEESGAGQKEGREANESKRRHQNGDAFFLTAGAAAVAAGAALCARAAVWGLILVVIGAVVAAAGFARGRQRKRQADRAKEKQKALREEARRQEEAKKDKCQTLSDEIKRYLLGFGIDVPELRYAEALHGLENDRKKYERLSEMARRGKEYEEYAAQTEISIQQFLLRLGLEPKEDLQTQVTGLSEELRRYLFAKKVFEQEEEARKSFEAKYHIKTLLKEMPKSGIADLRELNEIYEKNCGLLEQAKDHIDQYETQMEELLHKSDEIREAAERLSEIKEKIGGERKKYELLGRTREFLAEAKESLTSRYTKPLKKSFVRYYECVAAGGAGQYRMDANAKVTFEEQGMQRELTSHSAGYQDLAYLCLRFAFADAMYPGEKPMLILDDPFANLDEANMEGAKRLLKMVSREYQVLYFTCHESRSVERV